MEGGLSHFLNEHISASLPGGRHRMVEDLCFFSERLASAGILGGLLVVEKGFEHDGYSAPWFAAPLVWRAPLGPAAVHDKLCSGEVKGVSRELADAVILEAMEAGGMDCLQRRFIYRGTRIGDRLNIGGQGDEAVVPDVDTFDPSPGA
jgi:hypothetical protein